MLQPGKLTVMMATEGTYPFTRGGVSTWCDSLISRLPDLDFVVYSVVTDPHVAMHFQLPPNARLVKVPLWGTEEPSEHLNSPFSKVYLSKLRTRNSIIHKRFLPLFKLLIIELFSVRKDPEALGQVMFQLHQYFKRYEYKVSFRSELTWNAYKELVEECVLNPEFGLAQADVFGLIQSLGWIYRFLTVLNTPVPEAHVTHSAASAFCGIPCVLAKIERGTPFLLTEHGVYLREQYLSLAKRGYSPFLSTFLVRLIHSVTTLNYAYADQVSPVCAYNTRWETRFGVSESKIQVIYNGVDADQFPECDYRAQKRPTVVTVARIDPIKDIKLLIRSAAKVRERISNVQYMVYGSIAVPEYFEECKLLCDELGLGDAFVFAGHSDSMSAAYQSGDLITLTSISEAFPYSVVEAMMTGKPVIATDVGGIREALGDTGVLFTPGNCDELVTATLELLSDPVRRTTLGREARERALTHFTIHQVLEKHIKSYLSLGLLAKGNGERFEQLLQSEPSVTPQDLLALQQEQLERGYTFIALRMWEHALAPLQGALYLAPSSVAAPAILLALATVRTELKQFTLADLELSKYYALTSLQEFDRAAVVSSMSEAG